MFSADRLATRRAERAAYQSANVGGEETQHEMLRRLELGREAHRQLAAHCARRGIGFLSSGFDTDSVDFLVGLGMPAIKVPSGEVTNLPYLRHVGRLGRPVLLSTGMSTLPEVGAALDALEAAGTPRSAITVLHCTTEYPAAMQDVNLRAMLTLREAFGVEVGYSDHTLGIEVATAAAALGAAVIEKHFTLDRRLPGPDHRASLEPAELGALVAAVRNIGVALGDGRKAPRPVEERNMRVARRSIVARRPIRAGERFSEDNLDVKRPGDGLSPMRWDEVLGRPAPRDFDADERIEL
jgi:N,N'-diacetyllegionaminate synthase